MPEENVVLLKQVSEPLRVELHYEMYAPTIRKHPFFDGYCEECPHVMARICHRATMRVLVSAGDAVFYAGELPSNAKMYFVEMGNLSYVEGTGNSSHVGAGWWVSEAVLWTSWEHCGTLVATSQCRLCTISAREFQDVVLSFGHSALSAVQHGKSFVNYLNRLEPDDVTDLSFPDPVQQADGDTGPGSTARGFLNFNAKFARSREFL